MATYVTPKRGVEYIFYISLVSQANTKVFQSNPTIAAGDFKVSADGGALGNPSTLPAVAPASSKMVKVTLSAAEMGGDNVTLVCSDASGSEWCDLVVNIQTSARQIDDLAYPNTSGRGIDVTTGGEVGIDWANIGGPATTVNLSGTTIKTATDVETDTANIQTRIPATLSSGNMRSDILAIAGDAAEASNLFFMTGDYGADNKLDVQVVGMGANVLTASALATDAVTEVAAGVWDRLTSALTTVGSIGKLLVDNINATISSRATPAQVNTEVDTALADIHLDRLLAADYDPASKPGVATALLNELIGNDGGVSQFTANALELAPTDGASPSAATIADAVWDEARAGHVDAGSFGQGVASVQGNITGSVASLTTNNDKTGYALSAGGVQAIWDALTSALTTVGSVGKLLVDNVNATISSRSSHSAADVWAVATRLLTAGTNIVLAKGTGVTGFNDLSAAQVNAEVVDALATDTYAEPGQGTPAATASLAAKINYLYKAWRNKKTQTATTFSLFGDDAATVDHKATLSDDNTTFTSGEITTGP